MIYLLVWAFGYLLVWAFGFKCGAAWLAWREVNTPKREITITPAKRAPFDAELVQAITELVKASKPNNDNEPPKRMLGNPKKMHNVIQPPDAQAAARAIDGRSRPDDLICEARERALEEQKRFGILPVAEKPMHLVSHDDDVA